MKEKRLVYSYTDSTWGINQVEIPKAALIKFIKEVCLPMREASKNRVTDNNSGYFSKTYSAKNYAGFVFDKYFEDYANFVLFICDKDGDCYVQFAFDDDSNILYEISIYWNLNKKNEIEFDFYQGEIDADI